MLQMSSAKIGDIGIDIFFSTGKFDSRGRPIPGLATLPQREYQKSTQMEYPSYNVQPQREGFQPPQMQVSNSGHIKNDGKIYVGGMPPSLSEAHLHVLEEVLEEVAVRFGASRRRRRAVARR